MNHFQIATVVFNSLTHAAIKGIRGSVESQQLIFHAGDLHIHLRISTQEDEKTILGQLLPQAPGASAAGAKVSLRFGTDPIGSTLTNSVGEFRFNGVPAGALTLEAEIAPRPSVIANFKVIGD